MEQPEVVFPRGVEVLSQIPQCIHDLVEHEGKTMPANQKHVIVFICLLFFSEGGFVDAVGGEEVEIGEEGGGWDVDDDDLELPPDLVRLKVYLRSFLLYLYSTTREETRRFKRITCS